MQLTKLITARTANTRFRQELKGTMFTLLAQGPTMGALAASIAAALIIVSKFRDKADYPCKP
jgi:hypothetical protein